MLVIQRPTVEAIGEAEGNRQKFAVSPLEPGFGHTLGNSLRRTLLSSIPGAAITQLRFDDALHEFDTITGVTEDVTDIILNLKDLVLVCHSDEPQGLELGEVATTTAGSPDLDLPIEDLDLSERPRNCLKRAQVNSIGELLLKTEDDLLAITNFGQKSLDEVIEKLNERGLALRTKD